MGYNFFVRTKSGIKRTSLDKPCGILNVLNRVQPSIPNWKGKEENFYVLIGLARLPQPPSRLYHHEIIRKEKFSSFVTIWSLESKDGNVAQIWNGYSYAMICFAVRLSSTFFFFLTNKCLICCPKTSELSRQFLKTGLFLQSFCPTTSLPTPFCIKLQTWI